MIVLPLFWDQVDNAQRVDETGFGRRLATYDFEDEELTGPSTSCWPMKRFAAAGHGLYPAAGDRGTVRAADLIERSR